MKSQNKKGRRCCNHQFSTSSLNKARNRKILELNNKQQIKYNKRNRKYGIGKKRVGFDEYVIYSILNTDIAMELGVAASAMARSILALYNKLKADHVTNLLVRQWQNSGENIIVLRGFDHKHLKYLENEARFVALGKHAIYHRSYYNVMLVLSVFGRKEEIQDIFEGLSYLR